jgi:hypothetical protein
MKILLYGAASAALFAVMIWNTYVEQEQFFLAAMNIVNSNTKMLVWSRVVEMHTVLQTRTEASVVNRTNKLSSNNRVGCVQHHGSVGRRSGSRTAEAVLWAIASH